MDDKRLIEDFLPIEAISREASREKSVRKGHISTLHLWWARRPLVACRAAVYGAFVPASRFQPANGPEEKRASLGRANAARFVERLCKYPGDPRVIAEAQRHILEAHAERLTKERGTGVSPVSVEDILEGHAPRPKVLDMFAGGGSIPLEALHLGCEAYALELNPVAHIIELCTLVYPQKYGRPDPTSRGMTGPKNEKGETTWGGLAEEVRYWGKWVLEKVKAEIGDLYPLIPDPDYKAKHGCTGFQPVQKDLFITRRNLPHWQMGGSTYFVTFRTKGAELSREARRVVLDACLHFHGERYTLWAAVVMPDHVHLLLRPEEKEPGQWWPLSSILHSIKSFTAKEINKILGRTGFQPVKGSVWQDESFDRIVRDEEEFLEKWNYIRNNPVKRGLCSNPESWDAFYECTVEQASSLLKSTGKMPVPPEKSVLSEDIPQGYLVPVAYLWTRTVRCKNPSCGATVPLVKQTWLCKKKERYVALKMVARASSLGKYSQDGCATKKASFEVVEAATEKGLGFDPTGFSKGGNATCPFCGTVADSDYVKAEGCAGRMGQQMMALVCTRPGRQGKVYLSAENLPKFIQDDDTIRQRIDALCARTGLTVPTEPIEARMTGGICLPYGLTDFGRLFTSRQMLCLLTFTAAVRQAEVEMRRLGYGEERTKGITTYLGMMVDKLADFCSTLCVWNYTGGRGVKNSFGRQALPMTWDFSETNPFNAAGASWVAISEDVPAAIELLIFREQDDPEVCRGSATALPWSGASFDAVITDPSYYDNVDYAKLADFFYVWLRRTIGYLYSEHFTTEGTPKKSEIVADPVRHGGSREKAKRAYEAMMTQTFAEAHRVLKPGSQMTVVYAHKTTLGWSTLVNALRQAGFTVTEAWPLDTEKSGRLLAQDTAALASSIFLVARKREGAETGSYEDEVRPELEWIVRERMETLWEMGITGADLIIAAVGAGLRAFTRFARVEYANGEEVPAERFLTEVEGVVLETLLEKIFVGQASSLSGTGKMPVPLGQVDGPSRFYVLWRYTYKAAELDAGEAIVFTYGQPVELDGSRGLSTGSRALVEKKKGKYRLRDYTERGQDEKLGLSDSQAGTPAALIDALHRVLWLIENEPRNLGKFLDEAKPDRERLRLVAQALAGAGLKGKVEGGEHLVATTASEQAALGKLLANWRALIEASAMPLYDRRSEP